ncbi:phytanoyl-CoA dioxygenase family protein [Stratiformator vulcanicus]|uniref:Phytanoyl-CoA dioxygenase (PhyH) n=1 Tax=Stratiformator vulcanicus TaxID=2527980 RepID=A0A517QW67_9PLAN|nr:phytanoyl-CoA dioxygenase family protein [Stratiformator vulcanicus]QDT35906.1 hypothetical protein Pan189_02590 [Stratiformator vulcanicus]
MNTVYFNATHDDDRRRDGLYNGQLYVYTTTRHTRALRDFARDMCEQAFAPHHPPEAQHHLPVEQYVEILKELKPKFIHHPTCKELIRGILADVGADLEQTHFDVPRLRTACAGDYLKSGLAYAFKPHRDTWYSPPQCQLNWWLPIYEVESENVMAFHPKYWTDPVSNSSEEFNYQDWNQNGRKAAVSQGKVDSRRQSEALETLELDPQVRVVTEPGGLLIFSAAHLHSTVPNTTNQTRFSIDFRTVDRRDLEAGRGAPNIDSKCSGTTIRDYLRGSDFSQLPSDLIARFDRETAPANQELVGG